MHNLHHDEDRTTTAADYIGPFLQYYRANVAWKAAVRDRQAYTMVSPFKRSLRRSKVL